MGLVTRLEADTPEDAGLMVAFVALAFVSTCRRSIAFRCRKSRRHGQRGPGDHERADAAAVSQDKIEVTYRPYLSTDIEGPQMDPPITLVLSEVEADPLRVTGRARMLDIGNKAFPAKCYTAKDFPGLAR